jgi:tetratricopeptide (TPR) repeat protein
MKFTLHCCVFKEPFLIPWYSISKLRSTPEQLMEIFIEALASCTNNTACNLTECILPLERNLANCLASLGRMIEAKQRFEDLIQLDPKNEDVWFAYAATVVDGENGVDDAKEVSFWGVCDSQILPSPSSPYSE